LEHDDRLVRNLRSLLEVSKAMAGATDLDSLLAVILERVTVVMEAERATLFIHDESTATLWNRLSGSLTRGQLRIPMGTGIAGHVAQTGRLLNVPDAYADPRFNPRVDMETGFHTRSILCVPMFGHDRKLVGVVQVLNKVDRTVFTSDDEELLEALASHAALALDRARLVEAFVEKQRIEEGLRLAHEIQMAMLPRALPREADFDLAAELRPARSVGGDLYDFFVDGRRLWFLVGDVAGKGVAAALYMAVAGTSFRASLQADVPLSAVLARVNRELCRNNGGAMFVTAFAACLDLETGDVETGNAGHNPPYHLGRNGAIRKVTEPRGVPLGVIGSYEYPTSRLRLEPGDGLYLYTDGVTEALNERGEAFSGQRLEAYLGGVSGARAAELVSGSLSAVQGFVGGAEQFDDIAILAVRYLGGAQA
jgi:sigma-B regulation protein RsbU (phosphoserine phosphatase)